MVFQVICKMFQNNLEFCRKLKQETRLAKTMSFPVITIKTVESKEIKLRDFKETTAVNLEKNDCLNRYKWSVSTIIREKSWLSWTQQMIIKKIKKRQIIYQ